MKKQLCIAATLFLIFLLPSMLLPGCSKDDSEDDGNNTNNSTGSTPYTGDFAVYFVNQVPPMYADDHMEVHIDKDGKVTIDIGIIQYSGDTIFMSGQPPEETSKLERSGLWEMTPTGTVITAGGKKYLKIDAHIEVINDIQKVYAKNNQGVWQQVSEIPFSGNPNSILQFDLEEANLNPMGAKVEAGDQFGNITWFLILSPGK